MELVKRWIILISISCIAFGLCQTITAPPEVTIPPKPVDCNKCKEIICCKASKDNVCIQVYPVGCEKCNIKCDEESCSEGLYKRCYAAICCKGPQCPKMPVSEECKKCNIKCEERRDCNICKRFYCPPKCESSGSISSSGNIVCPQITPPAPPIGELKEFCEKCKGKGEVKCDDNDGNRECKVDADCREHKCPQPAIYPPIPYRPVCENGKCVCKPGKPREKQCPPYRLGFCGDECRPVCEDGKWICKCKKPPVPPTECNKCIPLYCNKTDKDIVTTPELAAFCRICFLEGKIRCRVKRERGNDRE